MFVGLDVARCPLRVREAANGRFGLDQAQYVKVSSSMSAWLTVCSSDVNQFLCIRSGKDNPVDALF
jgi:hypothetical protein